MATTTETTTKPFLEEPAQSQPHPLLLWGLRLAALLALLVSGYLAWAAVAGDRVIGCGGGWFDCQSVLSTRWSRWFGLPVAFPAVSLYATLLITLCFAGPSAPDGVRRISWLASAVLATVAGAAALWFVALQLAVVGGWCLWCMAVHVCGVSLAVGVFAGASFDRKAMLLRGGTAAAVLGLLITGQFFSQPPDRAFAVDHVTGDNGSTLRFQQNSSSGTDDNPDHDDFSDLFGPVEMDDDANDNSENNSDSNSDNGAGTASPPPADESQSSEIEKPSRIISVLGGRAEIDTYQHPVLGRPDAPFVIAKLFDYTCQYCREIHTHLTAARERYGDDLAIVMMPVPMNPSCNAYVRSRSSHHKDACALARLALAVWRISPSAFEDFDAFLFDGEEHPSVELARVQAELLVGKEALDRQLADWRLHDQLQFGVKLYATAGRGAIPKVLVPPKTLIRGVDNREEFFKLLENELGLQPADQSR